MVVSRKLLEGGLGPPSLILLCGLIVLIIGIILFLQNDGRQQTRLLKSESNDDESHLPAQDVTAKKVKDTELTFERQTHNKEPKIVGKEQTTDLQSKQEVRNQRHEVASKKQTATKWPPEEETPNTDGSSYLASHYRIPKEHLDIFESIDKIPLSTKVPPVGHISSVTMVNASLKNVVKHLRRDAGVKINFESERDEYKLPDVMMQNITIEDLMHYIAEQTPHYKVFQSGSGWTLRRKDSPLSETHGHYEVSGVSREEAFFEIDKQVRETLKGETEVLFALIAIGKSPELSDKVNLSLSGDVYDALDNLLKETESLGWHILWHKNRASVTITSSRRQTATQQNVLKIVGSH